MATYPTDWDETQGSKALDEAEAVKNYFFHDDEGAHVTTVEGQGATGDNALIDSTGFKVRKAQQVVSWFGALEGEIANLYADSGDIEGKLKIGAYKGTNAEYRGITPLTITAGNYIGAFPYNPYASAVLEAYSFLQLKTTLGGQIASLIGNVPGGNTQPGLYLTLERFRLNSGDVMATGRGTITDLSFDGMYDNGQRKPGTYFISNTATGGPSTGYGNLLLAYSAGNRVVAIAAYDNGSVWMRSGAAGGAWRKLSDTYAVGTGSMNSGWTVTRFRLAREGTDVNCQMHVAFNATSTFGGVYGSVPAGYRPKVTTRYPATIAAVTTCYAGFVEFRTNGEVYINSGGNAGLQVYCNAQWEVA